MTGKQQVFVEEYLACWNATEAARRAGYKSPNVQGPQNLVKLSIAAAIRTRVAEKAMTADEVLLRLAEQARADFSDFIDPATYGKPTISLKRALEQGKGRLVKKISTTKTTVSLELHDSQNALIQLGRAHGLFVDKTALTDPSGEREWLSALDSHAINREIIRVIAEAEAGLLTAPATRKALPVGRNRASKPATP